jgi:hypothetical protein
MLEQHHVLVQGPPRPQPQPCFRDFRAWVEAAHDGSSLWPFEWMFIEEYMFFDLSDLVSRETLAAIDPRHICQVTGEVIDVV